MRLTPWLLAIAACGGSDSDDQPPADAFDTARCLIAGNYGDVGTKVGEAAFGPTTSTIVLDPGPPRDSFFLKLVANQGVFAAGLAAGTFAITGAELDSTTCGLCVNLLADIGTAGPAKFYFADGGSVTLTSTNPVAGTLTGITLHEVTSGGVAVAAGCTGSIGAMSFTTQVAL